MCVPTMNNTWDNMFFIIMNYMSDNHELYRFSCSFHAIFMLLRYFRWLLTFILAPQIHYFHCDSARQAQHNTHTGGGVTAHSAQRTAHSVPCTVHRVQRTVHRVQRTAHSAQSTKRSTHSAQRTAHGAQRTAHSTQHTAHSAQRTAHTHLC